MNWQTIRLHSRINVNVSKNGTYFFNDLKKQCDMRNTMRGKKFLLLLCAFLILSLPISSSGAKKGQSFKVYQYEKKDKEEEQKKFIAKLTEDKQKIEMAIKNTKALIDKSRDRPYLPEIYIRLAELYIEKSRIVYFLRKTQSPSTVNALNFLESNSLKNQAIEIYQRILNDFPKFEERDKIHFYLAHEYRELAEIDKMVEQYRIIIKQYTHSSYVPESFLLLGDYFFDKQDLEMATKHYEAVLKYPESSAIAIARYKLAWCHINEADFKKALTLFEESVLSAQPGKELDVDTYKRVDIRLESLIDMAYCYCEVYKDAKPEQAIAYFQKFAWSRPVYTTVLEKLAYRYLLKKKWKKAAAIYRQLSILQHDVEKLLEYARKIFECVQSLESFEDADQDMAIIIKALRKQKYSIHIPEEEKKKNLKDYEMYARDIVTHLHHKARHAKSKEVFKRAADSYKLYLDFFKTSPVYKDMEANYAEALFSAQEYMEAGKQYEKLALRENAHSKKKREDLYSAVLSYYAALKNKENLNYYQIAYTRAGLRTTGKTYAVEFPKSKQVPNVLFNVAWIAYDAGKYDDAIAEFSQFVDRYPRGKEAKAAIHLILDAFHLKEDYEGLVTYGQKILRNNKITDKKIRAEVAEIVKSAESKVICNLTLNAVNDWERGKDNIMDFVEQHASSSMGEQALVALILPSKEKGDLETMISAGTTLIKNFPSSPKIEDTLNIIIDSSLKSSQFRLLAQYLEVFGRKLRKHKNAVSFLYQAAQIRENLGQYDLSNKDYKLILTRVKKGSPLHGEIILAMAHNAEHMSNNNLARGILINNRGYLSSTGKIKAAAKIADYYFQDNRYKQAERFRKIANGGYTPSMAKKDSEINSAMAQMEYSALQRSNRRYMKLQLKDHIDNQIVTAKAKLLEHLENGYHTVIKYQVPEWALNACYRLYEVNKEFARFLKESPLPQLPPEQEKQYVELINQKAQGYNDQAEQYLKTSVEQARKWEVCDPKLSQYVINPSEGSRATPFSRNNASIKIGIQFLKDDVLKRMHYKLLQGSDNMNLLSDLAKAYIERRDFRQTILIAQKALEEIKAKKDPLKATVYNSLGVAYLYKADDTMAKDAFKKALDIDSKNIGARINLASLYQHYGHRDKAKSLYKTLPNSGVVEESEEMIHPHARELYYAYIND
ncbi:MAG: tetratricopeptide repeat protein [bacterium]